MSESKSAGSPLRFWPMVWPLFVDLLLYYAILFTDSFFLSRISDRAAASVGGLFAVYGMCVMLFNQMGQAGCSVASQYIGAERHGSVSRSYAAAVVINGILGLGVGLFMLLFAGSIGRWVGLSPADNVYATTYIAITGPALFLLAIKSAYTGIVSSQGKTYWSMFGSVCYNLTNIGLNVVFLTGAFGVPKLGVRGVSIATVVSELVLVGFLLWVVHSKLGVRYGATTLRELGRVGKQVLRIGLPASLEPISVQLIHVFVTAFILVVGMQAMAAKTYVTNIALFILAWSIAVGVATQVTVARSVGAKRYDEANRQMHFGLAACLVGVVILVGLSCVLSRFVLGAFTDDQEIVRLGVILLLMGFLLEPLRAVNIVTQFSLLSTGDAKFTAFVGTALMWGVGLPACYLIGVRLGYGIAGIWAGMILDELIRAIVYYARWRSRRWEHAGVIEESGPASGAAEAA